MIKLYIGILVITVAAIIWTVWPKNAEADRMANASQRFATYGCGNCHAAEGIQSAIGRVGPSLNQIRHRALLAGHLPNNPANLIQWIRHPQDIDPKTAMPNLNVTHEDAVEIVALLNTLD